MFLDQCVHHPLLYFPVFYSLKAAMSGKSVLEGLQLYQTNFFEDMARNLLDRLKGGRMSIWALLCVCARGIF